MKQLDFSGIEGAPTTSSTSTRLSLSKFIEFAKTYQIVVENLTNLEEQRETVEGIYVFLRGYQVKISMEEQLMVDSLYQKASDLGGKRLAEASAFLKEQRPRVVEELAQRARAVEEQAA